MITVRLQGGLGNQMFQYALGRTLAHRHGTSVSVDVASYQHDKRREYLLGLFNVDVAMGDFPRLDRLRSSGQRLRLPGFAFELGRVRVPGFAYVVKEKSWAFDPAVLDSPDNVYLDGFWQSERYFAGIAPLIRKEFALHSANAKAQELAGRIRCQESVCVNVRRADFVSDPEIKSLLGFVGMDYYTASMQIIRERVKNPAVFVFSDEVEWCLANLRFDCPAVYVGHEYAGEKFLDYLYLMSLCKHFVVPNSTFAWWAAWLSNTPGTIVGPKRWFNAPELDSRDVLPAGWVQL